MRSRTLRAGVALAMGFGLFAGPLGAAASQPSLIAQATPTQGTLAGVVVDNAGRPISSAAVTITGGGITRNLTTDTNGTFSVPVPAGVYALTVQRGGFRPGQSDDVVVPPGGSASLRLSLAEANLQTLQTIGRTSASSRRALNVNTSAVTSLPGTVIEERQNPRLNELVAELPGVTLQRGNLSPNADFVIRGGLREARTFIDGHPVSSGNFGAYNTGYTDPFAFSNVEITKGPGFFGPNGAETVFGTANLVTPGFVAKRQVRLTGGVDSLGGSLYDVLYRDATPNQKFQWVVGKSFAGTRDANDGNIVARLNGNVNPIGFVQQGTQPTFSSTQPVDLAFDASNRQQTGHELFKAQARLSETTSISGEFLGLHGGLTNQGGNYGGYIPNYVVPRCVPTTTNAGAFNPTCDAAAAYNNPYYNAQIGNAIPVLVGTGLGAVKDNEQFYAAEFRTSFKNDTIIVRPYAASILRLIMGGNASQTAGYAGLDTNNAYATANSWYVVTNPATQCNGTYSSGAPAVFNVVNKTTGAASTTTSPTSAVNVVGVATPARPATGSCVFANGTNGGQSLSQPLTGTAAVNACPVVANPNTANLASACFIAGMVPLNNGALAFGRNTNQPETDTLHGVTFQYTHPFGDNALTFGYDYNTDNSNFISGDITPYTVPMTYGNTNLNQIPALYRKNTFSLGLDLHLTNQLEATLGGYYLNWQNNTYQIDPNQLQTLLGSIATNAAAFSSAPLVFAPYSASYRHFDPRVGLTFRLDRDTVFRGSVGSAVTVPYPGFAGQLPGLRAPSGQTQPQASNYIVTQYNPNLKPQTTTAYDIGFDHRNSDGGVLQVDAFNNTIYNAFASSIVPAPDIPSPVAGFGVYRSTNINAGIQHNYGVEFSLDKIPQTGWGYRFTTTLQRNYFDQLDPSLFTSSQNQLVPLKQIDTTPKIPFSKAYAELRYASLKRILFTFGADYTGAGNQTNSPTAFTTFNSTLRFPVGTFTAQFAGDNIFNYNTAVQGYGGLYDAGNYTLTYGNTNSTTSTTGGRYGLNSFPNNILRIPPRVFRFSLSKLL